MTVNAYGEPFETREDESEERAYVRSNYEHLKELGAHYTTLYGPKREVLMHRRGCPCEYCFNYRQTGKAIP